MTAVAVIGVAYHLVAQVCATSQAQVFASVINNRVLSMMRSLVHRGAVCSSSQNAHTKLGPD